MTERRRFLARASGWMSAVATAAIVDAPNVIALPTVQWRMSTAWTHRSTCSRPHDDMILGAYEALPSICEGRSTMAWPRPTSTASRITVSREERDRPGAAQDTVQGQGRGAPSPGAGTARSQEAGGRRCPARVGEDPHCPEGARIVHDADPSLCHHTMMWLTLIFVLLIAIPIGAVESICIGGANHSSRPDIIKCADFEGTSSCTTGQELACWSNNNDGLNNSGLSGDGQWFIVQRQSDAAVGSGYARVRPLPGSTATSAGPVWYPLVAGEPPGFSSIEWRWYERYSGGHINWAHGGHGPEMVTRSSIDKNKFVAFKFQHSNYGGDIRVDGIASCNGLTDPDRRVMAGFDSSGGSGIPPILPNQRNWTPLLNNQWYRLEMQVLLDTSC